MHKRDLTHSVTLSKLYSNGKNGNSQLHIWLEPNKSCFNLRLEPIIRGLVGAQLFGH
jgi:hypothetical protein